MVAATRDFFAVFVTFAGPQFRIDRLFSAQRGIRDEGAKTPDENPGADEGERGTDDKDVVRGDVEMRSG